MIPKKKLLIVEDSEEMLEILVDFFDRKNLIVESADNGLEGLKLFEADRAGFDLIITDIVLPHISGAGIISIVKKKNPEIPVIAITGLGELPEALAAEAKADYVLEKPFDLDEFDALVKKLLYRI